MSASRILTFTVAALGFVASASLAQPKPQGSKLFPEVFDDDWTPPTRPEPKPVEAPATKPSATPQTTPPTPKPEVVTPPPTTPPVGPVPVPAPEKSLLDIPAADAQAKSRKLMRELFAQQLVDKTPAGRQKLVRTLLAEAEKVRDNVVDRYVLLSAVLQAAREASDVPALADAAEQLAGEYKVDALAVKAETAGRMNFKADTPAATSENVKVGLALVDELLAEEDFAGAGRVAQAMQPAVAADPAHRAAVMQRVREINLRSAALERVIQAAARLQTVPDDPAALSIVGSYLCFYKNDWAVGLPMLARSGQPLITTAATADLTPVEGKYEQIAEAWWAAAERDPTTAYRLAMKERAAYWYRKALAGGAITGLNRTRIDMRLAELKPVESPAAEGPKRGVLRPVSGAVEVIELGGKQFANRDFVWSKRSIPPEYIGKRFILSKIESVEAECTESGAIYAITHAARPNSWKDSQEKSLTAKGFQKVSEYKYGPDQGHVFVLLKKDMRKGEKISVGKFSILIF